MEYSLRAFPLGGFVGFPDDDPANPYPEDDPDLFGNRPIPQRAIVISAGVIANLVFAFTILFAQVILSSDSGKAIPYSYCLLFPILLAHIAFFIDFSLFRALT